jgi:hypothetical protein
MWAVNVKSHNGVVVGACVVGGARDARVGSLSVRR